MAGVDHDLSTGDRVVVSNRKHQRYGQRGRIIRMDRGNVWVEFPDATELRNGMVETQAMRASSLRRPDVIERLAELAGEDR